MSGFPANNPGKNKFLRIRGQSMSGFPANDPGKNKFLKSRGQSVPGFQQMTPEKKKQVESVVRYRVVGADMAPERTNF